MPDLNQVYSRLGTIEAKVDILLARDAETQKRISQLERFEAKAVGIAAAVAAAVTFLTKILI